jgi:hypothetical protein
MSNIPDNIKKMWEEAAYPKNPKKETLQTPPHLRKPAIGMDGQPVKKYPSKGSGTQTNPKP